MGAGVGALVAVAAAMARAFDIDLIAFNAHQSMGMTFIENHIAYGLKAIAMIEADLFGLRQQCDGTGIEILCAVEQHTHDKIANACAAEFLGNAHPANGESIVVHVESTRADNAVVIVIGDRVNAHFIEFIGLGFRRKALLIAKNLASEID